MPYGETWFQEGDTNNAPKYNSQELDPESNFYYYNARHYSQEIARFVTADSVIDGEFDTQGWNRYAYTKGNPIRYKDPSGHDSVLAITDEVFNKRKDPHNNKEFNTYKAYVYKDGLLDAETKYKLDKLFGTRFFAEKHVMEVTKDAERPGSRGPLPPSGEDRRNEFYKMEKAKTSDGIEKYRIGEKIVKATGEDKTSITPEKGKADRVNTGADGYNKPRELAGCIGFTNSNYKGTGKSDPLNRAGWGSNKKEQFKNLNEYLEEKIPDLIKKGETVYVSVENK